MARIMTCLFAIFILSSFARAQASLSCEVQEVDAYYSLSSNQKSVKSASQRVFILNRGALSEIRFIPSNQKLQYIVPDTYLGTNLRLEVTMPKGCFPTCKGKVIKVLKALDPFESPKLYRRDRKKSASPSSCS